MSTSLAAQQVIEYRPLTKGNGIFLDGEDVVIYSASQEIARVKLLEPVSDLTSLLLSYRVPDMFPDLVFCHTKPENHIVSIDYSYTLQRKREVHGWITLEGDRFRWWARWKEMPRGSGEISLDRTWLHADEIGKMGFEFCIPPALARLPDPLVVRRLVLALESFIYALREGWDIDIPYRHQFNNLFSSQSSLWRGDPPAVTTDWESPLLRSVRPV